MIEAQFILVLICTSGRSVFAAPEVAKPVLINQLPLPRSNLHLFSLRCQTLLRASFEKTRKCSFVPGVLDDGMKAHRFGQLTKWPMPRDIIA